jgi:hypothetical protein
MTNKEALVAVIRVSIPETSLEKSMLDRDIIPGDGYTKDNAKDIDLCAIELLAGLLNEPDVSEGGYSVKYDRNSVKERLLMLAKKHNATDILDQFRPSVSSPSVW